MENKLEAEEGPEVRQPVVEKMLLSKTNKQNSNDKNKGTIGAHSGRRKKSQNHSAEQGRPALSHKKKKKKSICSVIPFIYANQSPVEGTAGAAWRET